MKVMIFQESVLIVGFRIRDGRLSGEEKEVEEEVAVKICWSLRRRDVWSVHDFGLSKYKQAEELLVVRVCVNGDYLKLML